MKVLIIGLAQFTAKVASELQAFDPGNTYIRFDTYHSVADKLRYYYHLFRCDIVYSINGTLEGSAAFDLALKRNRVLIIHWVGSDVLRARKSIAGGKANQDYLFKAIHFCEVSWIEEELQEIGINADIVNFFNFSAEKEVKPLPASFSVMTYIGKNREEFYGMREISDLASEFPMINFNVAGIDSYKEPLPNNIKLLGWVKDMDELLDNTSVCIRYTEHDGLSGIVLEALAKGRYMIYNNNFPGCKYAADHAMLKQHVTELYNAFENGSLAINQEGIDHIHNYFGTEKILSRLVSKFQQTLEQP